MLIFSMKPIPNSCNFCKNIDHAISECKKSKVTQEHEEKRLKIVKYLSIINPLCSKMRIIITKLIMLTMKNMAKKENNKIVNKQEVHNREVRINYHTEQNYHQIDNVINEVVQFEVE